MKGDKEKAKEYLKKLQQIQSKEDMEATKGKIPQELKEAALRYWVRNKEYAKAIEIEAKRLWKWLE